MDGTYEQALVYLERGWSVAVLKPQDKRPLIPWKTYQTQYATTDEVFNWFVETENNIGIVAGALSNLTIVDCDSPEAIQFFEQTTLEAGGTVDTYTVKTPKGRHYYFTFMPGSNNFQAKKEWPGIDLRSEGGYVAAPNSIHPSGVPYEILQDVDLAQAPAWLFVESQPLPTASPNSQSDIFAPCIAGGRNMALTRLAGALCVDLSYSKVLSVCQMWNRTNLEPLPEDELVRTVQSIASKEAKKRMEVEAPIQSHIKRFIDLKDEVLTLRKTGVPRGVSTGFSSLDENYRVPLGQITIITGMPGSGKTTFLNHLMINLMENYDWSFLIYSGENVPYSNYAARLISTYLKKPFYQGPEQRLTEEETLYGLQFLEAHGEYFDQEEDVLTVAGVLREAAALLEKRPFKGLILDPWSEFDHTTDTTQSETNVFGQELSLIRGFARRHNIHVWIVAHPRQQHRNKDGEYVVPTAYDISGSANFRNRADFCLTIHRAIESTGTEVHVQKVRFAENGQVGIIGLGFDRATSRYSDLG